MSEEIRGFSFLQKPTRRESEVEKKWKKQGGRERERESEEEESISKKEKEKVQDVAFGLLRLKHSK